MINIIEARIKMTKNQIALHEDAVSQGLISQSWDNGYITGLKVQLKTLEELLISAKTLQELSA
ncbi:hypothetical protein HMPREF3291_05100 [Bacillus sp. HMSC76G11]|nr:hypothetical protein HMPREF3291_05100 [Bacillus sp. HMSC76G11]